MKKLFAAFTLALAAALVTSPIMPVASSYAAEPSPQRVDIILTNFSFTPSEIRLKAGQPVHLHFSNNASGGHDFTAKKFFSAATMDDETRTRLGKKGKVSLKGGKSADLLLTPAAGTYKLRCTHFLHSSFGMTGTIVVE